MILNPLLSRSFLSRSRYSIIMIGNKKFSNNMSGDGDNHKNKNNRRSDNRQTWKKIPEERHKGSIDLETVKASEEYKLRIDQGEGSVKRKYAVCFGYLGSNYQGLQINPDCKSVEAELEKALFLCGGIEESNFGFMGKTQWSRAARTDRGVHAGTQCCAMKLSFPEKNREKFVDDVNKFLPEDIRVHLLTKVSKGFNAKNDCTKRRYDYLLPTYVLSDNTEVSKLLADQFASQGEIKGAGYEGGYLDPALSTALTAESLRHCRESLLSFRAPESILNKLKEALQCYVGTKFFHNFTSGKSSAEANSQRYILSFDCNAPIVIDGVEYVLLSVLGQSFLLNQIRKMICMACEVARGVTSVETVTNALKKDVRMDIPMVPGEGLYLREIYFDLYNQRLKNLASNEARGALKRKLELEKPSGGSSSRDNTLATTTEVESGESGAVDENINKVARSEDQEGSSSVSLAPEVIKEEEGEGGEEGKDEDAVSREDLNWCTVAESSEKIAKYCNDAIHPHIRIKERDDLPFLYYLDYLRVCPHHYTPKL